MSLTAAAGFFAERASVACDVDSAVTLDAATLTTFAPGFAPAPSSAAPAPLFFSTVAALGSRADAARTGLPALFPAGVPSTRLAGADCADALFTGAGCGILPLAGDAVLPDDCGCVAAALAGAFVPDALLAPDPLFAVEALTEPRAAAAVRLLSPATTLAAAFPVALPPACFAGAVLPVAPFGAADLPLLFGAAAFALSAFRRAAARAALRAASDFADALLATVAPGRLAPALAFLATVLAMLLATILAAGLATVLATVLAAGLAVPLELLLTTPLALALALADVRPVFFCDGISVLLCGPGLETGLDAPLWRRSRTVG